MGNVSKDVIRKKNFPAGSKEERYEELYRTAASKFTDLILRKYAELEAGRNGRYINSDLMKMVFPKYRDDLEHRRRFNMSITNSAAVLTNEAFERAMRRDDVHRCIFVVGPYGAGKSWFAQSLFENDKYGLLSEGVLYEGSITPPAFDNKIEYALQNGVIPDIIALNPTLELSMRNIRKRAKEIGRDVTKEEVVSKFYGFHKQLSDLLEKFPDISCAIYNKESNTKFNIESTSDALQHFGFETIGDVEREYDKIKLMLDREEQAAENEATLIKISKQPNGCEREF